MNSISATPKVSVIIPVYKAEKYIEKCARSLFSQSLDSIEYIFVDDCTPDHSFNILFEVLNEFPCRKKQVVILKNEYNMGVGQTRQRGIDRAMGDYIIHCDPDDWADIGLYEEMLKCAESTDADVVICDYIKEGTHICKMVTQFPIPSREQILGSIVCGCLSGVFWNKLIKRSLAKTFPIEPGINMWEDLSVTTLMLLSAHTIEHISSSYYHYRMDNRESYINVYNEERITSQLNAFHSLDKRLRNTGIIKYTKEDDIVLLQWQAIHMLLKSQDEGMYRLWNTLYSREMDKVIRHRAPFKSRLLIWLAVNRLYKSLKFLTRIQSKLGI